MIHPIKPPFSYGFPELPQEELPKARACCLCRRFHLAFQALRALWDRGVASTARECGEGPGGSHDDLNDDLTVEIWMT